MKLCDLTVELVPASAGKLIERADGCVLARPGQVYSIRLQNHSWRRMVVDIVIDGTSITPSSLVLDAFATVLLERSTEGENGRFTFFAEGDEEAFGDDGGRDNPDLGLIEVSYRYELRRPMARTHVMFPYRQDPWQHPLYPQVTWTADPIIRSNSVLRSASHLACAPNSTSAIEGAGGTALTGASSQCFSSVTVGPLDETVHVLRLRLVVGSEAAFLPAPPIVGKRPLKDALRHETPLPPRPEARP